MILSYAEVASALNFPNRPGGAKKVLRRSPVPAKIVVAESGAEDSRTVVNEEAEWRNWQTPGI